MYVNVPEVLDCVYMSEGFFANASRPSEPSTPPLSNGYPLLILWGGGGGRKLIKFPELKICGALPPLHHMSPWRSI
jgi:hypothetical protein